MNRHVTLLLCLFALAAAVDARLDVCMLPAEGSTGAPAIDLNLLAKSSDYMVPSVDQPATNTFEMNICQQTKQAAKKCPDTTMICELDTAQPKEVTTAYLYTTSINVERTPQGAKMTGVGAICPAGGNYKAEINFVCKQSGASEKPVSTAVDKINCKATFRFETIVACGGTPPKTSVKAKLDVGMLLCLLFFIPLIIYFAAGAGLMYRQGRRGSELVPNNTFWFALPGLVKDGFVFTIDKARGSSTRYEKI